MYLKFKRLFDFFISFAILLLLFPLFIIVAVLIKLDSKGPIFYLQSRVGENGRVFRIYKLRTMTNKERDPNVKQTYLQDPDITRIGGLLRRFKIDELPERRRNENKKRNLVDEEFERVQESEYYNYGFD